MESKRPCVESRVKKGWGKGDSEGRKRQFAVPRTGHQAQCVVPLARCVPQRGDGRLGAAARPAARQYNCAGSEGRSGSGRGATDRGVGAQDRPASAGSGFFAKSLQAFKGVSPEQYRNWRDSIYAEIGGMMQLEIGRAHV